MSLFRLAIIAAVLVSAAGCGNGYSSSPSVPSPAPSPPPGGPSMPVSIRKGAEVLGDQAYVPNPVTVDVGTTVVWTNSDTVSHTSTSGANGWDSGVVVPGGQFSFTFQSTGTFPYHCSIHPGMVGTVVVR